MRTPFLTVPALEHRNDKHSLSIATATESNLRLSIRNETNWDKYHAYSALLHRQATDIGYHVAPNRRHKSLY